MHVQNPPRAKRGGRFVQSQGQTRNPVSAADLQAAKNANLERNANARLTASTFMPQVMRDAQPTVQQAFVMGQNAAGRNPRGSTKNGPLGGKLGPNNTLGIGETEAGRQWVDAILHPCCEPQAKACGIPDRSSSLVVAPCYRSSTNISITPASGQTTWDLQVLLLPIPEIDYIYRTRANSAAGWGAWTVQYLPNFKQFGDGAVGTLKVQGIGKQRIMGRGHTMHLRASGTTNQGMCFAGQVTTLDWKREYDEGFNGSQGVAPATYFQHRVPLDSAELVSLDPAMVEWEAVNGVYMPLRFTDAVWNYYDTYQGLTISYLGTGDTPTSGVLPASWTQLTDSSQVNPGNVNLPVPLAITLPSGAPTQLSSIIPGTSEITPFLTGVVFFEGLDVSASIQVKTRQYMENQPEASVLDSTGELAQATAAATAIRPFAEVSPLYDKQAIEVAALVAQAEPHAYPASANDFSSVMRSIWDTVKSVGKHVVGFADVLSGLGVPVAGTVSTIGHALGL